MEIIDIKNCLIKPFDIEDQKLLSLFSFFIHSAPTIDSKQSAKIPLEKVSENWNTYIKEWPKDSHLVYSDNKYLATGCNKVGLTDNKTIDKKFKAFVCIKKRQEKDCECVLRHIRNAIAHAHIYYKNWGNRKFVLFEDYSKNETPTAIILMSQTDMQNLKKQIMK